MSESESEEAVHSKSNGDDQLDFLAGCRSPAFTAALDVAARVAPYVSSVLIKGETGVGKEIVARYIHARSPRAASRMLIVNCGALPETLLESEMFGHKSGAFTGAIRDRVGLFEQAARGTILLDEIGEISPAIQVKLLRVLQEREITRVGESIPRRVDTRIIAAANRDLADAVRAGSFRADLLYRLKVVEIEVAPLRRRPEDILPLAEFFAASLADRLGFAELNFAPECLTVLHEHTWPGNARELQNAIERAAVLGGDGWIRAEHLPPSVRTRETSDEAAGGSVLRSLAEVEMDHIRRVVQFCNGNRDQASRILGISKTTLWRKLR